jgi:hypothetical protein
MLCIQLACATGARPSSTAGNFAARARSDSSKYSESGTARTHSAADKRANTDVAELSDDSGFEESDENESILTPPGQKHPFDGISDGALRDALRTNPESLGSVSIGSPNAGQLLNGVRPPISSTYHLVDPEHAWGTEETVNALCHSLDIVAQRHPGTPVVDIGHLSARHGGPLRPHRSHQSGRDVDVGLYYSSKGTRWYTYSDGENLDVARTWTLVQTLAKETDVEMILLDRRLQELVESYALSVEHDSRWVHVLFHGDGAKPPLLRHSPGHATHLHVRFMSSIARRSAIRLAPMLSEHRVVLRENTPIVYVAKSGDTLAQLAQRYHTTMSAIRAANKMRGYQLVAGHAYRIPIEKPTIEKSRDCGDCIPSRAQPH